MWQKVKYTANSMVNNAYHVIISIEANNMFNEHVNFLAQVSQKAALTLSSDLFVRLKELGKSPYLYPLFFSEKIETKYRKLTFKRYLVLYTINEQEKTVEIEYIWDTRKYNEL